MFSGWVESGDFLFFLFMPTDGFCITLEELQEHRIPHHVTGCIGFSEGIGSEHRI